MSLGARMSSLTSLSCGVAQSELFAAVFLIYLSSKLSTFARAFCSFESNNCYDLRESIADTPKRSIINEFDFALSVPWGNEFGMWRHKNPRISSLVMCMKSFDCYAWGSTNCCSAFCFICFGREIQLKFRNAPRWKCENLLSSPEFVKSMKSRLKWGDDVGGDARIIGKHPRRIELLTPLIN